MKKIRQLEELRKVERKKYHPLKARLRKDYRISRKALFYIKEYGPHSNVPKTIIKESIKILLLASLLSSFGGLALEHIKTIFVSLMPLIVMLPALNDMLGDFGIIISSRFTTLLYTEKLRGKWHKDPSLRKLMLQVLIIAVLTALISSSVALAVSYVSGFGLTMGIAYKIFLIGIIDTMLIISILFFVSIIGGLRIYKKNEDPDNFLIPMATSIADFGNMILLTLLVLLLF